MYSYNRFLLDDVYYKPKVTIVRDYDTNNIDIREKPKKTKNPEYEEVTVEEETESFPKPSSKQLNLPKPKTTKTKTAAATATIAATSATANQTKAVTNGNINGHNGNHINSQIDIGTPSSVKQSSVQNVKQNSEDSNKSGYEIARRQKPMRVRIHRDDPNNQAVALRGQGGFNTPDDMEREMERRKLDWDREVMKMQKQFFKLAPGVSSMGSGTVAVPDTIPTSLGTEIIDLSNHKNLFETKPDGSRVYKLRFNVKGFKPHEITVKLDGRVLRVSAKHAEEGELGDRATKNFDRKMDLPDGVDVDLLTSEMTSDGVLVVEAPADDIEEEENVHPLHHHRRLDKDGVKGQGHEDSYRNQHQREEQQNDSTGSAFTIGDPFNAVSLKSEDRIMTPRILVPYDSNVAAAHEQRLEDEWEDAEFQRNRKWDQQNRKPLEQHHRYRRLFPGQKIDPPQPYSFYRGKLPLESYAPKSSIPQNEEGLSPAESFLQRHQKRFNTPRDPPTQSNGHFTPMNQQPLHIDPDSFTLNNLRNNPTASENNWNSDHFTPNDDGSYMHRREHFTPADDHGNHGNSVTLPSGFRLGTEETETVYHKGGFITAPASVFSGITGNHSNQKQQQQQQQKHTNSSNSAESDVFGHHGNDAFNSMAASFSPLFLASSKTSKRGASHLERVNQNASKLKLSVDVGDEYLPEEIQVSLDGRYIHVKACHEQKTPTGRTAKREYNRMFDRPDDLDLETLQAVLDPSGRLIVGASLVTNLDKYAALDSIQEDLPPDGTNVEVVY